MSRAAELAPDTELDGRGRNLALATWSFAITFWAWNLIGPLAVRYAEQMHLGNTQKAFLVATPVLVGALGRIPVGALTDHYGGRLMFPLITLLSAPLVLLLAFAGNKGSYSLMLVAGFFLGLAGTTFAIGIPFVNQWYLPSKRGFATGLFGAGMGGTALSSALTPRFVRWFGYTTTHLIIAGLLAATAALCWTLMRNSPRFQPNNDPVVPKLAAALRLPVTWQMSLLYGVLFGGFVAFSTYLPTYLKDVYSFDLTAAGTRTAGFAIAAVIARPLGGVLSDRLGPARVVRIALLGTAALAVVVALRPPLEWPAGLAFVALAFFLGLGTGGVFAWVAKLVPAERVGTVTGLVGAAGGLGGYFPPLVMGATYGLLLPQFGLGLGLLTVTALGAFLLTRVGAGRTPIG